MATISHEMRFGCQKLKVFGKFGLSDGIPFACNEVRVSKIDALLRLYILGGNLFARNEVRVSENCVFAGYNFGGNPFTRNEVPVSKTGIFL